MNKLQKLTVTSTVWNVLLLLLLFFQSSFIYAIVEKNLFPTFSFIQPLLDDNFAEFITNRAIVAVVTIAVLILVEIILFFIVNIVLQKKYKKYIELESAGEIVTRATRSARYYKYVSLYLASFILVFVLSVSYHAFSLVSISQGIDLSVNNQTINSVYTIAMQTEFTNLGDIQGFIETSTEKIKNDSEIYSLIVGVLNFADVIYYINRFFYTISYLVLAFGIYLNTRLFLSLNNKGVER